MGVKTSFLKGVVQEEIYVDKTQGFGTFYRETHVCTLIRAHYGLQQAPRAWYTRIDSNLSRVGFTKSEVDPNVY